MSEDVEAREATTRVFRTRQETPATDPDTGQAITITSEAKIIQKGSGLCYRDPTGTWVPADPRWNPARGLFSVSGAAYGLQAGLAAGDGVAFNAQGKALTLVPHGAVLMDGEKESPLFQVDDGTAGFLRDGDPRKLAFPSAYGPHADLDYEVSPPGFHQNVHFRSLPELPAGFTPETTSILLRTALDVNALLASGLEVTINGERLAFPGALAIRTGLRPA